MKYYWKDIVDDNQQWKALELTVEGLTKPTMQLLSGHNLKTKLVYNQIPLFWAKNKQYYYVDIIRTFSNDSRLLGSITSQDIEQRKDLNNANYFKSWIVYFIERMLATNTHFFNNSLWQFKGYSKFISHSCYCESIVKSSSFSIYDKVYWGNDLIYSRQVDEYSGRFKWWRKKAIEGTLPPVFAWYIPSLGGYWIIDGNYRLRAAILEKKEISVVLAYSGEYRETVVYEEFQKEILSTFDIIKKNKGEVSYSTALALNQRLAEAFDDRPYFKNQTFARANIKSDQSWLDEIDNYLKSINYSEREELIEQFRDELSGEHYTLMGE
ncbi:ParB/Srx family N-terminal domain-containing protein [Myroides albus]|uniref:ParB/Sulfiredoxin domain-containing protein n=1 Tax=Myroides albus TaxID=2562892 RepID=A0A6I3LH78_9FLAO|nr:ParB/Srx family N-terminal domain-containing protein [Myroides albus]MTG98929.1 hypothetical protein [Myroides albus]UVD80018.1 ParB/Srx family N-terminal domain-containing protein [Myroides albus]